LKAPSKADGEGFEQDSPSAYFANRLRQLQELSEADFEAVRLNIDLQAIVRAWPSLPAPIKAGILAMIRATAG
jgi:hypothetical protein